MEGAEKWLTGQEKCELLFWDGKVISVQPPVFVELKLFDLSQASKVILFLVH